MPFVHHTEAGGSAQGVPIRSAVRLEDTWDLTPLYVSEEAWEGDFQLLQERFPKVAEFRGRAGESAATLLEVLEFEKSVDLLVEKLGQYASLRTTEDSSANDALAREGKLESLFVRVGEAFSFVAPELQAVPDEVFAGYLADPLLSEWVVPLKKLRRLKPHTLSASEERLLALGSAATRGHGETFSQLTNVDMKFGKVKDGKGQERELTQSSFSSFLQQRDPAVRREAFHKFYAEFRDHQYTIASSYTNSVRADVFYARARNYPSAIEAALFRDDVPLSVYDNLISTVREHLPPLYRYFDLRKRVLGSRRSTITTPTCRWSEMFIRRCPGMARWIMCFPR